MEHALVPIIHGPVGLEICTLETLDMRKRQYSCTELYQILIHVFSFLSSFVLSLSVFCIGLCLSYSVFPLQISSALKQEKCAIDPPGQ